MAIHSRKGLVLLQMILLLWTIKASGQLCANDCGGGINIQYPFGIGEGCYFDKSFEVVCNYSSGSPKALLKSVNLEILRNWSYISSVPKVGVYVPVIPLNSSNVTGVDMKGSSFTFSQGDNRLAATGCDNFAKQNQQKNSSYKLTGGGCQPICTCDPSQNPDCCDVLCSIPPNSQIFNANTSSNYSHSIPQDCNSVFVVQQDWLFNNYQTNSLVLKDQKQVPAVLEWAKYKGVCYEEYNSHTQKCNKDNRCLIQLGSGHFCLCISRVTDFCSGFLFCNATSGQNCSECPAGYYWPSSNFTQESSCLSRRSRDSFIRKKSRDKIIIIGCITGVLGMLLLLTGAWWLYKFVKRIGEIKLKQKFFKRNGGLLLQQELGSNKGNIEKTKLFTSKELEKATDNFNTNRILGQGGQGTVYKGMLADGKIVAVKKSKKIDESKVDEFINEVVILSQINHRNVVKLLGCCLETEVPLLVYEFIPNGTLFQYIHDQSEEFPITWEMRLRIAVEVSGAVSYLHSSASIPIYHRDIKSTNIILDDKYRAKVSDFGASRSMAVDQTHMTTQVHGTFGYLDPEYFRSSQFTEKSDVYSFGVVLAELLTGEKPIRLENFEEEKSLAAYFLCAMKEDRLFEILDAHVLKECCQGEITKVAKLTKRCLNLNGKKRPTMREVALQLAGIRGSNGTSNIIQESLEEIDCASVEGDIAVSFETDKSFTESFSDSVIVLLDAAPEISTKW